MVSPVLTSYIICIMFPERILPTRPARMPSIISEAHDQSFWNFLPVQYESDLDRLGMAQENWRRLHKRFAIKATAATGRKYGATAIAATLNAAATEPSARMTVGTQQVNPVSSAGNDATKPPTRPRPFFTVTISLARAIATAMFKATRIPSESARIRLGKEMNSVTERLR
ncbi:MAG: hypothetical protein M3275_16750 [Thermoproteota archaeon]|nr:hypothetical protein [Thermoproteota archaeon]